MNELELERLKELTDKAAPDRYDRHGNLIPPVALWDQAFKRMVDDAIWWHCYKQRTQIPAGIVMNTEEWRGALSQLAKARDSAKHLQLAG